MSRFHNTKWLLSRGLALLFLLPFMAVIGIVFISIVPFMCLLELFGAFGERKMPQNPQYSLFPNMSGSESKKHYH